MNTHIHAYDTGIAPGHGHNRDHAGGGCRHLFVGLMGTPYQSDLTTSLFRLVEETLNQGHHVTVWTCGYGTMLTQSTLVRPPDALAQETSDMRHWTTAEIVQSFFRVHRERIRWYVCRYCMEERGAVAQIPQVEIQIPYSFYTYLSIADQSLVLGVKS